MGNLFSRCMGSRTAQWKKKSPPEPFVSNCSTFYKACRDGDRKRVQVLLPAMSIEQINRTEGNGSTALHAACFRGHYEIARLLLEAGASASIRNQHNLTAYEESNEQIKKLFHRTTKSAGDAANEAIDRFAGTSVNQEWMMVSKQAAEWKINLYNWLKLEQSFADAIGFLLRHYLPEHVFPQCQSDRDKQTIEWFFRQALATDDVEYLVKVYTATTPFYTILNNDLRKFLFRFFRQDFDERHPNTAEKSVGYMASIFIYHPHLRSLRFTGLSYRGLLLTQRDLATYTVGKRLLNKSFLSSSTVREVAETFAGVGMPQAARRNMNEDLIRYTTICTYRITNSNTALNIGLLSEVPSEKEVLIMPLCAFQVQSVKEQLGDDSKVHVEIELIECEREMTVEQLEQPAPTARYFRVV